MGCAFEIDIILLFGFHLQTHGVSWLSYTEFSLNSIYYIIHIISSCDCRKQNIRTTLYLVYLMIFNYNDGNYTQMFGIKEVNSVNAWEYRLCTSRMHCKSTRRQSGDRANVGVSATVLMAHVHITVKVALVKTVLTKPQHGVLPSPSELHVQRNSFYRHFNPVADKR